MFPTDFESQFENLEREHNERVNERFPQSMLVDNGINNQQIHPINHDVSGRPNIRIFVKSVLARISSKLFIDTQ